MLDAKLSGLLLLLWLSVQQKGCNLQFKLVVIRQIRSKVADLVAICGSVRC